MSTDAADGVPGGVPAAGPSSRTRYPAAAARVTAHGRRFPRASAPGLPSAVLWDMDGLLVDSEPLWTVAEEELAPSLGAVWTA